MIQNKVYISEVIGGRLDFQYIAYKQNLAQYKFPIVLLSELLKTKPQYGANEAGVSRLNNQSPRYIRITDINEYGVLSDGLGASAEIVDEKYILNNNDILIARSGNTVGKAYIHKSKQVGYPCFFAGYMIRFIVDSTCVIPDYIFILTQLSFYKRWVKVTQRITGQPNINAEEYKTLPIPLPPIKIQQQIVDIYTSAQEAKQAKEQQAKELLNSIDGEILNQLQISLPTKKESAINDACYHIRLSDLLSKRYDPYYHNPYFNSAFQKLYESKYPLLTLGKISTLITSGITPKSGGNDYTNAGNGIAFIRSGDIDIEGKIDFDSLLYIKPEVHNTKMKSSQVKNNDIMIAIVGATIGQVGIYHSEKEANINQAIALVRLEEGHNPEYIKEVIKSSIGQLNLDRLKRPVARANINLEEIASMVIPVPAIEIQDKIVERIFAIRQQAKLLQQKGNMLLEHAKQEIENIILGS